MDLAVTLVKAVMRAFYSTREILVIDALILHETLRDDDLAYLMAINTKDLHKICGKLREDRFLTVHTRAEFKEGNPRPSNRTWYYINYRRTIDAIKWKVYTIDKEVQGSSEPVSEKKDYICNFCKAGWTIMEVLDNAGPGGFLCHRCGMVLQDETNQNAGGHEQSKRLNDQFTFISELLPKIDAVRVPECDFDRALAKARPVVRDAAHQRADTIAADGGGSRPMGVKGLTNMGPQSIAVNISTSDGLSEADKEAERLRKEKIAQQNALPSWMSNSTVTGESFSAVGTSGQLATTRDEQEGKQPSETLVDAKASAQIDDIFERLKAEQAAERAREMEEEEDDDEEADFGSDHGFEDVPASGAGTLGTPLIKREASGEVSFGDSSDERFAKKVKVEPVVKKEEDSEEDEDEDEDEEMEFEDV